MASPPFDYRPLTIEQAVALTGEVIGFQDDYKAWALIRLLHGVASAYFNRYGTLTYDKTQPDLEGLVLFSCRAAFDRTTQAEYAYEAFAMLDAESEEDLEAKIKASRPDLST